MIENVVVRKDHNHNFVLFFIDKASEVDGSCPAFACLRSSDHVIGFESHDDCELSRGLYLQETVEVTQEEADAAVREYKLHKSISRTFVAHTCWKRR